MEAKGLFWQVPVGRILFDGETKGSFDAGVSDPPGFHEFPGHTADGEILVDASSINDGIEQLRGQRGEAAAAKGESSIPHLAVRAHPGNVLGPGRAQVVVGQEGVIPCLGIQDEAVLLHEQEEIRIQVALELVEDEVRVADLVAVDAVIDAVDANGLAGRKIGRDIVKQQPEGGKREMRLGEADDRAVVLDKSRVQFGATIHDDRSDGGKVLHVYHSGPATIGSQTIGTGCWTQNPALGPDLLQGAGSVRFCLCLRSARLLASGVA